MPARRPPGKRHETAAGADEVAALEPPPPPPPLAAVSRGVLADVVRDTDKDDLLDQRELNQKPSRKASGPGGQRVKNDDVLIDDRRVTKTAPTDPT
jgi:hypothetical protein